MEVGEDGGECLEFCAGIGWLDLNAQEECGQVPRGS